MVQPPARSPPGRARRSAALTDVYAAMRTGQLDMRTPHAQISMGLALLALGAYGTMQVASLMNHQAADSSASCQLTSLAGSDR